MLVAVCGFAQTFLTNGLVAYYPFNGTVADASGNGSNGTNYGGTYSTNQSGLKNGSLFLNNVNALQPLQNADYVGVAANVLDNFDSGTISVWVLPNDVTRGAFFAKQDSGIGSFAVFSVGGYANSAGAPATGSPGVLYFHPANDIAVAQSTGTIGLGQWQQVCVTFSPSNCLFYINGKFAGGTAGNYSVPSDLNSEVVTAIFSGHKS